MIGQQESDLEWERRQRTPETGLYTQAEVDFAVSEREAQISSLQSELSDASDDRKIAIAQEINDLQNDIEHYQSNVKR
jgi:hypothetical protein